MLSNFFIFIHIFNNRTLYRNSNAKKKKKKRINHVKSKWQKGKNNKKNKSHVKMKSQCSQKN